MTEEQVREAAEEYVKNNEWNKCKIVNVRRDCFVKNSGEAVRNEEWVVQFKFDNNQTCSVDYGLVVVDDATGVARGFDTL